MRTINDRIQDDMWVDRIAIDVNDLIARIYRYATEEMLITLTCELIIRRQRWGTDVTKRFDDKIFSFQVLQAVVREYGFRNPPPARSFALMSA